MKMENRLKGSYRNIVDVFNCASMESIQEGLAWYRDAHLLAQVIGRLGGYKIHPHSVIVGAGILSALSPQVSWEQNVKWAIELATRRKQYTTGRNHDKALRILNGEHPMQVLGGRKVIAFYKAIVAPEGSGEPVIDRHAVAVYMGRNVPEKEILQLQIPQVMSRVQTAYKKASSVLDVHHHRVQAITWSEWRRQKRTVPMGQVAKIFLDG